MVQLTFCTILTLAILNVGSKIFLAQLFPTKNIENIVIIMIGILSLNDFNPLMAGQCGVDPGSVAATDLSKC